VLNFTAPLVSPSDSRFKASSFFLEIYFRFLTLSLILEMLVRPIFEAFFDFLSLIKSYFLRVFFPLHDVEILFPMSGSPSLWHYTSWFFSTQSPPSVNRSRTPPRVAFMYRLSRFIFPPNNNPCVPFFFFCGFFF